MAQIHPLACVEPGATIADDAQVGPFCVIGPDVVIASGCRLVAHVHVTGHTSIGERTVIHPFASLGTPPQSVSYRGEPSRLEIGADCDIREGVTMNIGTAAGGGVTRVGRNGFFMANSHVAHDCEVGDHVVFANSATLGGHCQVGDHVFIGGLSAIHQFTRIGAHAMIGGVSGVRSDVVPFGLASGEHARLVGANIVGLKRRNFTQDSIQIVRKTLRRLFFGSDSFEQAVAAVEREFADAPEARDILIFVRSRGKRALCRPSGAYGG
ncbi:MAG TPA: acyl-ACP--UDP-N-acetylglucosamine O-acyltransferase [Xanthobacteraceae bacterium]|nr:acyl-ACP--UDP-N-acetylglucosamine O-acyltransferase [Xanthobacteraceae bacterium]